jgi:hypothetical protein
VYHTFKGWFSQADGGDEYTAWPHILNGDVDMYAQWTVQQFTITFAAHGGTAVPEITEDGGTEVPEPDEPTWGSGKFMGWFPEENSGVKYDWPHTLTKSLTMHAQWKPYHTVTFHPNGGASTEGSSALEPQSVLDGETAAEPPGMTKAAQGMFMDPIDLDGLTVTLNGWYTEPECSTQWNFGAPVTTSLNLYAEWTQSVPGVDIPNDPTKNIIENALAYINGQTLNSPTDYTIVLDQDISMASASSANITNANAVITLVGKGPTTISLASDGALFWISAGELVLGNNITLKGINSNDRYLVGVMSSAALTMKDGSAITDNNSSREGGGVYVYRGTFNMNGGTISGNSGTDGGGVYINQGSFTKTGPSIIYGDDNNNPDDGKDTDNTAKSAVSGKGHAVSYNSGFSVRYRDSDLGSGENINTSSTNGWGQ